jgi:beta-glucosidase
MQFSADDKAAIDTVCAKAARCIVPIVSGRPMIIDPAQLKTIDGLVASWLPGSSGTGSGRARGSAAPGWGTRAGYGPPAS